MKTTGDYTKIVEKAGTPLGNMLVKKDPWGDSGCGKTKCKVCGGSEETAKRRVRWLPTQTPANSVKLWEESQFT